MSDHEHDWQPVITWSGRYQCRSCGGLGYRGMVTPKHQADRLGPAMARSPRPSAIIPYVCKVKGCSRIAVTHRETQRCREHNGPAS